MTNSFSSQEEPFRGTPDAVPTLDELLTRLAPPWGERQSIYRYISQRMHADASGQIDRDELLPDEELVRGDHQLSFAPGALDGMLMHQEALGFGSMGDEGGESEPDKEPHEQQVLTALRQLLATVTDESATGFYHLLLRHGSLAYIDPLMKAICQDADFLLEDIVAVGHWLATEAADREAVKVGIALLSLSPAPAYREVFLTLGRHEEFSLYAAAALRHSEAEPDRLLWELAKQLNGWGRVSLVEQLAGTTDPEIKRWMLLEGFANSVHNDEIVLVCALTGDLHTALLDPNPTPELLESAGLILTELMWPNYNSTLIGQYPEAVETTCLYLRHLQTRELSTRTLFIVDSIKDFLLREHGAAADPALGWISHQEEFIGLINAIYARPEWPPVIREGLASDDARVYDRVIRMAKIIGLDIWETCFARLQHDGSSWAGLQTSLNEDRLARLLAFAEEFLPIARYPSGQAEADSKVDEALRRLCEILWRFSGQGEEFIQAGLRSQESITRLYASYVLASWLREEWSGWVAPALRSAIFHEDDEEQKEMMQMVLDGKPLGKRFAGWQEWSGI